MKACPKLTGEWLFLSGLNKPGFYFVCDDNRHVAYLAHICRIGFPYASPIFAPSNHAPIAKGCNDISAWFTFCDSELRNNTVDLKDMAPEYIFLGPAETSSASGFLRLWYTATVAKVMPANRCCDSLFAEGLFRHLRCPNRFP